MFKENRVSMIETLATIAQAILMALGLSFLVLLAVSTRVKPDKVKNHRFKYWVMKCDICNMEMYGSTQVSLNKTFMWHVTNKHGDAQ
jgi:hypothetical protein